MRPALHARREVLGGLRGAYLEGGCPASAPMDTSASGAGGLGGEVGTGRVVPSTQVGTGANLAPAGGLGH